MVGAGGWSPAPPPPSFPRVCWVGPARSQPVPQNVSGHLFPRTPGMHRAGELVAWDSSRCWAQPGCICGPSPATSLPAPRSQAPPLLSWTLDLHPPCPSSLPPFQVQPPPPHADLFPEPHPEGPSPASPDPRGILGPADSSCPSVRDRGRREGSTRWREDSSPLKQPTSSAMLAFSWVALHSSWVGGKVRAAPEPCCCTRPMACMRRC